MAATARAGIPRDPTPDATLALLRQGYRFIGNRSCRLGADTFRTRIGLRPVVCMTGAEAARAFSAPGCTTRRGALAPTTLTLLQDPASGLRITGVRPRPG